MKRREFIATTAAVALAPLTLQPTRSQDTVPSESSTEGASATTGLAADGVEELQSAMDAVVAGGQVPGVTWLLARGDDVVFGAAGTFEAGGAGAPMARDTIFRIASMTKPVTATAVMMLVEEGKVDLEAPIETYLPELADRQVLTAIDAPLDSTVPAERPITVRDIMRFTMGFGIQFDPSLPIQQALIENQMTNDYPLPLTPHEPDEWLRRFAALPLMAQPGSTWMYNTGSLLQGILIERVSGQSIEDFFQARIFAPLGMVDSGFWVPAEKLHRVPAYYTMNFETGETFVQDTADGAWSKPIPFPSTAGGMVSTVDDFLAFARMLMNNGTHNGVQLISPESVAEMTRDQLTPQQKEGAGFTPDFFDMLSWGYGMAVHTASSPVAANAGRYGWDGGFGTSWANDPTSGLIGMMMTQSSGYYVAATPFVDFWSAANAAAAT